MKEWYLDTPQPTFNGGFEQDEWDNYAVDAFNEALTETPLGDIVKLCKGQYDGETGLFETEFETEAIIQSKSPDAYTQGWQRQILTRMSDNISDYKYVKYKDIGTDNEQIFLIETMPSSNKIYTKAVIHECNYTLKWQDEKGQIYYYPTNCQDATQYNTGIESAHNIVQTGYVQLMCWVSLDEVTVELQRDKRMFISLSTKNPDTYIITSMSKVPYSYNQRRMMRITFTECEYNPKTDRIDLGLCDYIEPVTEKGVIEYVGNPEIRIGGKKTFAANGTFTINVADAWREKIILQQTGNKAVVKVANDSAMVGLKFQLIANGETLTITVKGGV